MSVQTNQFDETSLIGVTRSLIKFAPSFDNKIHSVPDKFDDRGIKFVAKIAASEIENDIESVFQKMRKAFKFKRLDTKVDLPDPGWGTIETPYFTYSINASLDDENLAQIRWERSIRNIKDPDKVGSLEFAAVFDFLFDRIELSFAEPIQLEDWIDNIEEKDDEDLCLNYDSSLTRCTLNISGIAATIHVQENKFAVVHPQTATTHDIIASYVQASKAIAHGMAR